MSATQTIDRPSQQQSELLNTLDQVVTESTTMAEHLSYISYLSQLTAHSSQRSSGPITDHEDSRQAGRQAGSRETFESNVYGKRTSYELRSTTWNMTEQNEPTGTTVP
jgi:hypothetical protein